MSLTGGGPRWTPQLESGKPCSSVFRPRQRQRGGNFQGGNSLPPLPPPLTGRRPQAARAPADTVLFAFDDLSIFFNLRNSHPAELRLHGGDQSGGAEGRTVFWDTARALRTNRTRTVRPKPHGPPAREDAHAAQPDPPSTTAGGLHAPPGGRLSSRDKNNVALGTKAMQSYK